MASTLFNSFFNLVAEERQRLKAEDGVTILYNVDDHLVGSRSPKHNASRWNELKFEGDTVIVRSFRERIIYATSKLFLVTDSGVLP